MILLLCQQLFFKVCLRRTHVPYFGWLKRITSLVTEPREQISLEPSGDQSNQKILSDLKSVTIRGWLPASGWRQMFETPSRVSTKSRARPSPLQRTGMEVAAVTGTSKTLTGNPPSAGMR